MGANKANNNYYIGRANVGSTVMSATVEAIVPIPTWQPLSDRQPSNKGVHAAIILWNKANYKRLCYVCITCQRVSYPSYSATPNRALDVV